MKVRESVYATQLAEKIMQLFFQHQRQTLENMQCPHKSYATCFAYHYEKIRQQIELRRQLVFVLPAFPAKSPNREKTMGPLPDLGERLALKTLNDICSEICRFYPMGAHMLICSDGRVFNDLVKVNDSDVDAYALEIRRIIQNDHLLHLGTFGLDDYYDGLSYAQMREKLIHRYGESLSIIQKNVRETDAGKLLFNGIHRFMYEDQRHLLEMSNTQARMAIKLISYQVIQRSNAWSHFIAKHFPDAIRLSIHPQLCGSTKLGVMLLKSKDGWATPWHRVVVAKENEYVLMRKKEAEAIGAKPQFANEQFSHYEM